MELIELIETVDILWIVLAAALVMFMQAGFTALESGLTRAKNSINVAMKNLTDFVAAVLIFWAFGYGLMFGESQGGYFGGTLFFLEGMSEPKDFAIFAFQVTFAGTAATIVSGAVAERMRFSSYVIVAVLLTGLVYPVSGHWIWGSGGWLAEKGFVDFAGSTVVHSLGGWVGLAGAWVLGARAGRFDQNGKPRTFHGQNLVLAVIGVLILWFGWVGFNCGSTLGADKAAAIILANTLLAAAAGGLGCFLTSLTFNAGKVSIEKMLNGVVGGLVSVTAGCAVLEPVGAVVIGLLGGIIVYFSEELVLNVMKVDDPVNVIAAHGVAGAWGTLGLALLAPVANLPAGSSMAQFGIQLTGVVAVFVWGFSFGLVMFFLLKQLGFLRVTSEAEEQGLNVHEHGASTGLLDTMKAMDQIVKAYNRSRVSVLGNGLTPGASTETEQTGDLTQRITVDYGAEGFEIAYLFNQLMDYFHDTVYDIKQGMDKLVSASRLLAESSGEMEVDAESQRQSTHEMKQSVERMAEAIQHIAQNTTDASVATKQVSDHTAAGEAVVGGTIQSIQELANRVMEAFRVISELQGKMVAIEKIVDTIAGISDQTNLLALNAAIEAARAGDVGRGFAVVAGEVRDLSRNTSQATSNIKNLIGQLRTSTDAIQQIIDESKISAETTVQRSGQSQTAIGSISEQIKQISAMSTRIAEATESQTDVIHVVEKQISSYLESATQAKERASSLSVTSDDLQSLADHLQGLVYGLKVADKSQCLLHAPIRAD